MPTNIGPVIGVDGEKEYRKQINQIIQQAKTLDAEMKAVTSSFDSQNDSQKKLTAQSESLTKQIENQEKRIDLLQQMTDKAAQKYGEADTRTLKWRQAVADATTALNKMKSELSQVNQELEETNSASGTSHLERLTDAIQKQEQELDDLKVAYQEAVLAKGRDSQEAQDAARKIQSLSADLKENKTDMQQLAREADSLAGELDDTGTAAQNAGDGFTVMKGALADLASSGIQSALGGIKDMATSVLDLGEATQEHRSMMLKMEGSAQSFGYEMDFVTQKYQEFYRYLGDDQMAVNAITNLTGMRVSTETVSQAAEAAIAVWASYGDSIPIESLTESINESSQVAQVTGVLADALNWAGISEDEFNTKLQSLSSTQERADLIAQTLNDTYGESKDWYDENAKSMLDTNDAQRELMDTQSDMAEDVDNLNVELDRLKTDALEALMPVIEDVVGAISDAVNWFNNLDDGTKDMITTIGKIAVVAVPTVTAIGKIGSAASGAKNFLDSFKSSADTAKQSVSDLDTSSKNTASNSGGISKLGSTLGTVFSGVGIVATGIGLVSGLVSWINDLNDAATNANFGHFSEQWDTINTGLSNAKSSLEDYNTQVLESNGQMESIEENLKQVQSDISTICTTASQKRRDLTQSEIDTLNQLFQKEQELTRQQLQQYQQVMDVAANSAQMDLQQAASMNTDQFNQALSQNYTTMMDAYQQIATYSDTWLAQQEAQLYSYYESRGQLNSAEHQQAVADARAQAEQMKTEAQNQVAGMLEQWLGYYEDKYNLDELYYQKTETYNTSLSQEWAKYLAEMDRIRQDSTLSEYERQQQLESATDYFGGRMSNIYQDLIAGMDEEEQKAADTYLRWAADTALWGGETSTEAQRMVQTIITAMDELPEETQTAMKESFNGAGQIIQQRAPGFIESCVGSFTGWVDDVFNLLGVNSPSRVMKQLFGYVMDGAEIGFDNGADNLLSKANRFTKDFEMALTPTLPDYSKQVRAAMEQMARVEQQAQIYSDLQSGGITVNWDGSPADYPTSTIQITVNAAPGQSEEQIADLVAYRLQHQVQQQRRGRL